MKRNLTIVAILIAVITAMLVAGKYLARQQASEGGLAAGDVKGQVAPDFELKTLDGKTLRLSDLKGKAVLLNFWATWCDPCKIEMPWFVDLQKQYGPQGLQIVGVALQSDPPDIRKFTQKIGVNYPILLGNDDVGNRYGGIQGLPTTFYVGRDGKLVTRYFGLVSHREIEENIQAALKQGEAKRVHARPAVPAGRSSAMSSAPDARGSDPAQPLWPVWHPRASGEATGPIRAAIPNRKLRQLPWALPSGSRRKRIYGGIEFSACGRASISIPIRPAPTC